MTTSTWQQDIRICDAESPVWPALSRTDFTWNHVAITYTCSAAGVQTELSSCIGPGQDLYLYTIVWNRDVFSGHVLPKKYVS